MNAPRTQERADARPPGPDDGAALRNRRVLIVAETSSSLTYLCETLVGAGAWVSSAVDGLDVVMEGALGAFDVVVADVTGLRADGRRLIQACRRFAPHIRTVALVDGSGAPPAEADACLRIPSTTTHLFAEIRFALERDERLRPAAPPAPGAILGASRDGRLLHALQAVSTLYGYLFVPVASATEATALLGEQRFRWVVVDEHLADGPGACLIDSLPLYSRNPQAILVADRTPADELRRGRPHYVVSVDPRPDAVAALRRVLATE